MLSVDKYMRQTGLSRHLQQLRSQHALFLIQQKPLQSDLDVFVTRSNFVENPHRFCTKQRQLICINHNIVVADGLFDQFPRLSIILLLGPQKLCLPSILQLEHLRKQSHHLPRRLQHPPTPLVLSAPGIQQPQWISRRLLPNIRSQEHQRSRHRLRISQNSFTLVRIQFVSVFVKQKRPTALSNRRRVRDVDIPLGQHFHHIPETDRGQFHRAGVSPLVGKPLGISKGSELDRSDSRSNHEKCPIDIVVVVVATAVPPDDDHILVAKPLRTRHIPEIPPKNLPQRPRGADAGAHGQVIPPRRRHRSQFLRRFRNGAGEGFQNEFQEIVGNDVAVREGEGGAGIQFQVLVETGGGIEGEGTDVDSGEGAESLGGGGVPDADEFEVDAVGLEGGLGGVELFAVFERVEFSKLGEEDYECLFVGDGGVIIAVGLEEGGGFAGDGAEDGGGGGDFVVRRRGRGEGMYGGHEEEGKERHE
mmetsp:Transcript_4197/g.8663  ORF Transcript_4197/g.8663 Transcript_4197/m.8663 type:complete len:475 (-) Transcript_4197:183-1607(-)